MVDRVSHKHQRGGSIPPPATFGFDAMNISNLTANPETEPEKFLAQIVEFLGEYYPVVQVFIQIEDAGKFQALTSGNGNILARMKQTELWWDTMEECHGPQDE